MTKKPTRVFEIQRIDIIASCRAQPPFDKLSFHRDKHEWEVQPDGSVIILHRNDARERKYVQFTAGQWTGSGVCLEDR